MDKLLDVSIYRDFNGDLENMSDDELTAHFQNHGLRERRIFGKVEGTPSQLSMRWLRGKGLEIGAGRYPLRLFGETQCTYADINNDGFFGGTANSFEYSLNDETPYDQKGIYDFVICSHVLEHVDSIILSLKNLASFVKVGGIVYFVVPDKRFLFDQYWVPDFDINHHLTEEHNPLAHAEEHTAAILEQLLSQKESIATTEGLLYGQVEASEFRKIIANGALGDQRFAFHQHTYSFDGWLKILMPLIEHIGGLSTQEVRYGHERRDCHFILERME